MISQDLPTVDYDLGAIDRIDNGDHETVLIVEDEPSYQEALCAGAFTRGLPARGGLERHRCARAIFPTAPSLVLLDLLLPDIPGTEVCRQMLDIAPVPIMMVSALGSEEDIVTGLDLGAMDYITKPYRLRGLIARMHAVLRRSTVANHPASTSRSLEPSRRVQLLVAGPIRVDLSSRIVTVRGHPVHSSRREFNRLALLLSPPGLVRTREELVETIWAESELSDTRTLDTHVRRLPTKLERDAAESSTSGDSTRSWIPIRGLRSRTVRSREQLGSSDSVVYLVSQSDRPAAVPSLCEHARSSAGVEEFRASASERPYGHQNVTSTPRLSMTKRQ